MTELMVVVVIIGILSAVGVPAYRHYVKKAKTAEAYTILANMVQQQKTYYKDPLPYYLKDGGMDDKGNVIDDLQSVHPTFHSLHNRQGGIADGFNWAQLLEWDEVGYPIPIGSKTYFSYGAIGGKYFNGAEVESTGDGPQHRQFTHTLGGINDICGGQPGCQSACETGIDLAAGNFVNTSPSDNYEWIVLVAMQDLSSPMDPQDCTIIIRVLEGNSGEPTTKGGFIELRGGPGVD